MEEEEHTASACALASSSLWALRSQIVGDHGTNTPLGQQSKDDPIEERARFATKQKIKLNFEI
jgi:hypothetical protein